MREVALSLELRLDANPLIVTPTRQFIEQALEEFVRNPDLIAQAGMATHELVENAAKYAPRGTKLHLSLTVAGENASELTLRLTNDISAHHCARLQHFISEINQSPDAMALYLEMMVRRDPCDPAASGLGLARIRAEGDMRLELVVGEGVATIVATNFSP